MTTTVFSSSRLSTIYIVRSIQPMFQIEHEERVALNKAKELNTVEEEAIGIGGRVTNYLGHPQELSVNWDSGNVMCSQTQM